MRCQMAMSSQNERQRLPGTFEEYQDIPETEGREGGGFERTQDFLEATLFLLGFL